MTHVPPTADSLLLTTTFFLFLKLLSDTGFPSWLFSLKSGAAWPTETIRKAVELTL